VTQQPDRLAASANRTRSPGPSLRQRLEPDLRPLVNLPSACRRYCSLLAGRPRPEPKQNWQRRAATSPDHQEPDQSPSRWPKPAGALGAPLPPLAARVANRPGSGRHFTAVYKKKRPRSCQRTSGHGHDHQGAMLAYFVLRGNDAAGQSIIRSPPHSLRLIPQLTPPIRGV
jgi:hypothetical protein